MGIFGRSSGTRSCEWRRRPSNSRLLTPGRGAAHSDGSPGPGDPLTERRTDPDCCLLSRPTGLSADGGRVTPKITGLIEKMRQLEDELEVELAKRKAELHFTIEDRRVRFEQAVLERQKKFKVGIARYVLRASPRSLLTAPVIYALGGAFLALDVAVSSYQAICFPAYGIVKVKRADHFVYDREFLPYLNLIEKANCLYCSYANGLLAYVREIGARTEQYWCPIKHARRVLAAHSRYSRFVDFGDGEAYGRERELLREDLRGGGRNVAGVSPAQRAP
jgi:hypothetical protein